MSPNKKSGAHAKFGWYATNCCNSVPFFLIFSILLKNYIYLHFSSKQNLDRLKNPMLGNYLKNHTEKKNINEVMEFKQTLLIFFFPFHLVKSEIMLCLKAKMHAIKTKVIIYIVAPSVNNVRVCYECNNRYIIYRFFKHHTIINILGKLNFKYYLCY